MNVKLTLSRPDLPGVRSRQARGFSLLECVIYIAQFAVVVGLGMAAFFQCRDSAESLRRTADDIVVTLKAGERWREDVRRAVGPLQLVDGDSAQQMIIPQRSNQVAYRFFQQTVWRRADPNGAWVPVLSKVKQSRMEHDARTQVTAWRWEVELKTRQPETRLRPLFSFEAMAPGAIKP